MIDVDDSSGTAPYEQIRAQVSDQVAEGRLQPGDRVLSRAKAAATAYLAETRSLGLSDAEALDLVANLAVSR